MIYVTHWMGEDARQLCDKLTQPVTEQAATTVGGLT